jgi:hypothetical protein
MTRRTISNFCGDIGERRSTRRETRQFHAEAQRNAGKNKVKSFFAAWRLCVKKIKHFPPARRARNDAQLAGSQNLTPSRQATKDKRLWYFRRRY